MPPTKHRKSREKRERGARALSTFSFSLSENASGLQHHAKFHSARPSAQRHEPSNAASRRREKQKQEAEGAANRGAIGGETKRKKLDVSDGDGDDKRKSFIALASRAHPSGPSFAPSFRHRAAETATGMSTSRLRVSDAGRGVNSPSEQEAKIRVSGAKLFFSVSIQKPPRARARGTLCAPSTTPRVKTTTYRGWRPSRRRRWLRRGRWPWRGA